MSITSDQYAFTALDMESKLLLAYSIGKRNGKTAYDMMQQLAERMEGAPEISTDAFPAFVNAINRGATRRTRHWSSDPPSRKRWKG